MNIRLEVIANIQLSIHIKIINLKPQPSMAEYVIHIKSGCWVYQAILGGSIYDDLNLYPIPLGMYQNLE